MPNEFRVKRGLIVEGSGSNLVSVDGISGRLFSVSDSFSGSLFSVNTVAGLPVIEAFSDNSVRIGQYGQRALYVSQSKVGIGKESALNGILDVSGSVTITGSFAVNTGSAIEFQVSSTGVKIGNAAADLHQVTGSMTVLGDVTISGSLLGAEPVPAGAKLYIFYNY
jgi:hypothetical protein